MNSLRTCRREECLVEQLLVYKGAAVWGCRPQGVPLEKGKIFSVQMQMCGRL